MAAHIIDGLIWGVSVEANAAFKAWGVDLSRVVQTMSVGDGVAASAGTHDRFGTQTVNGKSWDYGNCIDLSLTHPTVIEAYQDRMTLIHNGGMHGFLGQIRIPGKYGWPLKYVLHSHWIFVGEALSPENQRAAHEMFAGKVGLVEDVENPYPYDQEVLDYCRNLFLAHNPAVPK